MFVYSIKVSIERVDIFIPERNDRTDLASVVIGNDDVRLILVRIAPDEKMQ